jgi:hypothetical protein
MPTHVYIATTDGLVNIQNITNEPAALRSVICYQGQAKELPISNAYNQFVDPSTGLISKLYGSGAYCIDVDGWIESGSSWQLPVLIAHYCESQNQFASGEVQQGDTVIVATGKVNSRSQAIEAVDIDGIPLKLAALATHLPAWQKAGAKVQLIVPSAHSHQVTPSALQQAGINENLSEPLSVQTYTSFTDVAATLTADKILPKKQGGPITKPTYQAVPKKSRTLSAALGVVVIAVVALLVWNNTCQFGLGKLCDNSRGPSQEFINSQKSTSITKPSKKTPPPMPTPAPVTKGAVQAQLIINTAANGSNCNGVTSSTVNTYVGKSVMASTPMSNLCSIALTVPNPENWDVYARVASTYQTIPLIYAQGQWQLTLPKDKQSAKTYYWELISKINKGESYLLHHTLQPSAL